MSMGRVYRPRMTVFEGAHGESWQAFICPFERMASRYGWDDEERLDRLHESVRGRAAQFVYTLPRDHQESYGHLVEDLRIRFGGAESAGVARMRVDQLRQDSRSLTEYAEEVQRLTTLAYPGIDGYNNHQIACQVLNHKPPRLAEAQRKVEEFEHNYQVTVGVKDGRSHKMRRVSWQDEGSGSEEDILQVRKVSTSSRKPSFEETVIKALADLAKGQADQHEESKRLREEHRSQREEQQQLNAGFRVSLNKLQAQVSSSGGSSSGLPVGSPRILSGSPSPQRMANATCYGCRQTGHFKRDCTRSRSPSSPPIPTRPMESEN